MMVLNHALTLSVTLPGGAAAGPDDTALQSGLPGNTVPLGTAMDTASALQAGVVSNPSPNPIQRSSTSSGITTTMLRPGFFFERSSTNCTTGMMTNR